MKTKTQLAIENGRTVYTNNVYDSVSHSGKLLKVSNNNKNVSYDKGLKPFEFEVNYG